MELTRESLNDPELREALAEAAYLRERAEDVAVAREQDTDDCDYVILTWDSISDFSRRAYRTAVAETLDRIADVVPA